MAERIAAHWMQRADLARLNAALGPGQARYVGGAVRDTLLGVTVKDIDVATPLDPHEVMRRLKAHAISVVPTGIDHGTVTAVLPGGPVEITTLRRDVSTDGRHATVAFSDSWQEDAARRDFTINALYADPESGAISDFFGGLADLDARRVRFIGDARQRIREDHLRILRYFRFQARFGSQPADKEAEQACVDLAATLKGLSRERVGMEMMNLLGLPDPAPTVARMAELGVLAVVLPEARVAPLAALTEQEIRQGATPDALRRLAALLPAEVPLAEAVASRFRLSGAQKKRLATAAGRISGRENPRALAYRLGRESALDRLLLTGESTAPLDGWEIPTFPLKGGEIVARGIKAGPKVARTLQAVEARWIDEGFPGADRVAQLLDAELAANR
ncbi:MAG: CCA tRNA nucleotidyltransferase [Novosphingobium sp.]|uniref:CCA tRNA nucleotidyltransferase n=1 Tax=Novosphingobium sp. TaxID=1874826 RepID=UPI001DE312D5|nr:CCA tRNA nucleotidyltransferase [Novosphingobium sp.]MCB2057508.1 CCA tRNA nucleotidyltransferase [Novosphingobium sp.]MCP5385303.1 CCA tRNA nucleotidyltransferase [Novosphingobium sp.]